MSINLSEEKILSNVKKNITRGLPQVQPHEEQDVEIVICGGGPSLEKEFDKLYQLYLNGCKVVATNGSHDYLVHAGITPSAMVMVDGREFNSRFVKYPIDSCKYFIASQCDPSVFDALKNNKVWIWHAQSTQAEKKILDNYYYGYWMPIISGSTVVLRAMLLMKMLGFRKQHIFGFDSCFVDDKHHSYSQPENENDKIETVKLYGKEFKCSPWMQQQYKDFVGFTKSLGREFDLVIYGDGLIAHSVRGFKLWRLALGISTTYLKSTWRTVRSIWTRITFGYLSTRRHQTHRPPP